MTISNLYNKYGTPGQVKALTGYLAPKINSKNIRRWSGAAGGAPVIGPALIAGGQAAAEIMRRNERAALSPRIDGKGINSAVNNAIAAAQSPQSSLPVQDTPKGLSERELARYSDLQVRSQYRPTINDLTRQMESANAMGLQSQAAIGNWGREAGSEIAGAGRRNYKEVRGIQGNLGGMLAAVGAASGNMSTKENNRAFLNAAAGGAGAIAGLGAADQGWFNRARDVNAQTTNFYRNNARDQYAQQAYELQQKRNDQVAQMRDARAGGRLQAKQQAFENQMAGQGGSDGSLGIAMANFQQSIGGDRPIAQLKDSFKYQISSPQEQAMFDNWVRQNYYGGAGTQGAKNRMRWVKANAKQTETK